MDFVVVCWIWSLSEYWKVFSVYILYLANLLSDRMGILGEYDKNNLHTSVNLNFSLRNERLDHSMRRNGQQTSHATVSLIPAELSSQAKNNRNLAKYRKIFQLNKQWRKCCYITVDFATASSKNGVWKTLQ
jgi:hypothetical protein